MKNKAIIGGVAFVALVVVVYFAMIYPWPGNSGTEGTIGGVKKYNANQLSEKDVATSNGAPAAGNTLSGPDQQIRFLEAHYLARMAYVPLNDRMIKLYERFAPAEVDKRMATENQQQLADRFSKLEAKMAPQLVEGRMQWTLEQRMSALEYIVQARMAPQNIDARLQFMERSLGVPIDARQATNIEARMNTVFERMAISSDMRQAYTALLEANQAKNVEAKQAQNLDARFAAVEAVFYARMQALPVEDRMNIIMESRLAPNLVDAKNAPTLMDRISNVENRLAPNQLDARMAWTLQERMATLEAQSVARMAFQPVEERLASMERSLGITQDAARQQMSLLDRIQSAERMSATVLDRNAPRVVD
ncbi:MAG: hypothetical protein ACHQQQ_12000 [Bacteroidota bacterium]